MDGLIHVKRTGYLVVNMPNLKVIARRRRPLRWAVAPMAMHPVSLRYMSPYPIINDADRMTSQNEMGVGRPVDAGLKGT